MAKGTLYNKVLDKHTVRILPNGKRQLFVGRQVGHEVTSAPAFETLRERELEVACPHLTFFTLDHVIPTDCRDRPYKDEQAELMAKTLEDNVAEFGLEATFFEPDSDKNGVCHVTFPEQGVIWPGQVVVCGDSHTCTYGALGALAFGIGTTQVGHVLATQTLAMDELKVKQIRVSGDFKKGVTVKDLALGKISALGVKGGVGFVEEYTGETIDNMSTEERMILCNMVVEGGARAGYVNPDLKTIEFLRGREFSPLWYSFPAAIKSWMEIRSDKNAEYDDIVKLNVSDIGPRVTWGVNPGQSISIYGEVPLPKNDEEKDELEYMDLKAGQLIQGIPVDVVFIGSCTNGRLTDLIQAAEILDGRKVKVRTLVVPGSEEVKKYAEAMGLADIFQKAGAEWRYPGCSMCLAMNPDRLEGYERCASTSNRNFKGRQGSPTGRTHLMSPYTAAATAVHGKITDPGRFVK